RQLGPMAGLVPGFGAGVSVSRVPEDLEPFYGSTTPTGFQLFFRLRPAAMLGNHHEASATPHWLVRWSRDSGIL
ncbi:MAG: hypothetical protein ACREK5_01760, partial [Gemmatimonadota bacterium]